ncbi:MAG TPA: DUF3182 family protein, partial [Dehalococcoidia bacterium]
MTIKSVLIANRGEIAIRISRAASEMGIRTVAVYAEDDARSLHVLRTDEAHPLRGAGPAAYLDADQIIEAAKASGCDAVHPGYGFLSENAAFASECAAAGVTFVGPRPELLDLFGDKVRARELAASLGIPTIRGTSTLSLDDARAFLASLPEAGAIVIKAVAGGGGRGMRVVRDQASLPEAFERCQSEARSAFGNPDVYAEQLIEHARHIEVQIAGDGRRVTHLWERDCTIQRRHQKLIEIAPAPFLPDSLRARIIDAALKIAGHVHYENIGTVEFLVDAVERGDSAFYFIEANP